MSSLAQVGASLICRLELVTHRGDGCEVSPSGLVSKFLKQLDERGNLCIASSFLLSEASRDG